MSGKKITRREFVRDGLYALFGVTAAGILGKNILPPDTARAADDIPGAARDINAADMTRLAQDTAALAADSNLDTTSLSITRDMSKCIGCGKCVEICSGRQGLDILKLAESGGKTVSALKYGENLSKSKCIGCGQCARHCPSGAIAVKDGLAQVNQALRDEKYKYIVWQFAPSAQHIIGEEFRELTGKDMSRKIAAAVKELGEKNLVYSTDFGADITIMEEATEFVKEFQAGNIRADKPFMTSCCPGWINYVELNYPEIIPCLSSCKSPMEMLGSLIKSYLPVKMNVKASEIFHIAVMPCTAKKYERARGEMTTDGVPSVDAVLTVMEFKNLMVSKGIDLSSLADADYDHLFNGTSGAGRIFGATGGVCEAAMRTAYYFIANQEPPEIVFQDLRGSNQIKTAELNINNLKIRACVVNGIANIKPIIESIQNHKCEYDFIEVMACRGGCSGGGGTPVLFADEGVRHRGLYQYDADSQIRSSHHNLTLDGIYQSYLNFPGSERSEELLHTSYNASRA